MESIPKSSVNAESTAKTSYTEDWEKESLEVLYRKFIALVGPLDRPLIEAMTEKGRNALLGHTHFSALEIGAGAGRETGKIVGDIALGRDVTYTGIDVSDAQRKAFLANKESFPQNIAVENYLLSSWQDYAVAQKYDLIFAQHSWYGIGGNPTDVRKVVDSLSDTGIAFVTLSGIETISLHAWKMQGDSVFGAEDFAQAATIAGVSFEQFVEEGNAFTREDFYKDDQLTQKGIDLCGYLYKKELRGDEQEIISMLQSAPDRAFQYPRFLFTLHK